MAGRELVYMKRDSFIQTPPLCEYMGVGIVYIGWHKLFSKKPPDIFQQRFQLKKETENYE